VYSCCGSECTELLAGLRGQIRGKRGAPKVLCYDSGSEFASQIMDLWAYHNRVQIDCSQPGKPTDNSHVESFNGTLRAECVEVQWFATLTEAKQRLGRKEYKEYNDNRPQRSWENERRVTSRSAEDSP
jgi:putative transposase